MFTCAELYQNVTQVIQEASPPLLIVRYGFDDFVRAGDIAEEISFFQGSKKDFRDALQFCIKCFQSIWNSSQRNEKVILEYLQRYCLCTSISEAAFYEVIDTHTNTLKSWFAFDLKGSFLDAMLVFKDGDNLADLAVICETDEEFAAFFWQVND